MFRADRWRLPRYTAAFPASRCCEFLEGLALAQPVELSAKAGSRHWSIQGSLASAYRLASVSAAMAR